MTARISPADAKRILDFFYKGFSREAIGAQVRHSSSTVQRVIRDHELEAARKCLPETLRDGGLSEAYAVALLAARELDKNALSVSDCREAIPVAARCRSLGIQAQKAPELIEASVKLGQPEFREREVAEALIRILQREKQTGLKIDEIAKTHDALTESTQSLRSEESELQAKVNTLRREEVEVGSRVQAGRNELASVETQLQNAKVTGETLSMYKADRTYLAGIGLDIADTEKVRHVFRQLAHSVTTPSP